MKTPVFRVISNYHCPPDEVYFYHDKKSPFINEVLISMHPKRLSELVKEAMHMAKKEKTNEDIAQLVTNRLLEAAGIRKPMGLEGIWEALKEFVPGDLISEELRKRDEFTNKLSKQEL